MKRAEMLECSRTFYHKNEQQNGSDQGQAHLAAMSSRDEEYPDGQGAEYDEHNRNERRLNFPPFFIPTLRVCDSPADGREQRLQIELLVESKQQHQHRQHQPNWHRGVI